MNEMAYMAARGAGRPAAPEAVAGQARSPRFRAAMLISLGLLLAGEAALQLRSYVKTGRSAWALVTSTSTFSTDPHTGVKTYRPRMHTVAPGGERFDTNALGLRSPDIPAARVPGELRIAIAGASTVAGFYAARNEDTFAYLLERRLRAALPGRTVNVINAGIDGYALGDIERLLGRVVVGLKPDAVILYPGLNDMGGMCAPAARRQAQGLPLPALPQWVLSREIISKNTAALREPPVRAAAIDPASRFPAGYRPTLARIAASLRQAGIEPVFATVARSFKDAPRAQGLPMAQAALFYNSCLDYEGLNRAYELFNQAIAGEARRAQLPLLDLAALMPGGADYFVDASHFTLKGERRAAELIEQQLGADAALASRLGLPAAK